MTKRSLGSVVPKKGADLHAGSASFLVLGLASPKMLAAVGDASGQFQDFVGT
ncbi:MAG TPA: hypothetical protein VIG52_06235 [Methyloceanibacter sp.]|jgi:hypothetical protein